VVQPVVAPITGVKLFTGDNPYTRKGHHKESDVVGARNGIRIKATVDHVFGKIIVDKVTIAPGVLLSVNVPSVVNGADVRRFVGGRDNLGVVDLAAQIFTYY